jgi:hypothetical protein
MLVSRLSAARLGFPQAMLCGGNRGVNRAGEAPPRSCFGFSPLSRCWSGPGPCGGWKPRHSFIWPGGTFCSTCSRRRRKIRCATIPRRCDGRRRLHARADARCGRHPGCGLRGVRSLGLGDRVAGIGGPSASSESRGARSPVCGSAGTLQEAREGAGTPLAGSDAGIVGSRRNPRTDAEHRCAGSILPGLRLSVPERRSAHAVTATFQMTDETSEKGRVGIGDEP